MYVGLDIGTSSTKAVLVSDSSPDVVVSRRYAMVHDKPGQGEIDSEVIHEALFSCLNELGAAARAMGGRIKALSISASGNEATPVDSMGSALAPTIASMDDRGEEQLAAFVSGLGGAEIRARTGLVPHVMHPTSRLLWMRENERAAYDQVASFLTWGDLVASWLGISPAIDYSMASWSMAFDPRTKLWDTSLLEAAGIDPEVFPTAVASGTVLGTVPDAVGEAAGIGTGVKLVAGGFDQAMAAAGLGALEAGTAAMSAGTWEALMMVRDNYFDDEVSAASGFTTGCYVLDDLYYSVANNPGGSSVVTWALQVFGSAEMRECKGDPGRAAGLLISRATATPTDLIVTPHHAGTYNPWLNPNARGGVHGLSLTTTREDLVKGLLEGITYELRANLTRLEGNTPISSLVVGGGGSRSPEWMQLRADVLGRELTAVSIGEPGALAAAAIAGAADGGYGSAAELINDRLLRADRTTFEPRLAVTTQYDEKYAKYEEFYQATKNF